MKRTINSLCIAAIFLLAGCIQERSAAKKKLSAPQPMAVSEKTLCQSDERVIFSCGIERSTKTASICASPTLQGEGRYIIYRYGQPDLIELTYPEVKERSFSRFFYSAYARPLVTRQTLRFVHKDYEYVVEVESNAEESPHFYEAGISVSGSKNVELKCERDSLIGVDVNIQDVLPCDRESIWAEYSCTD